MAFWGLKICPETTKNENWPYFQVILDSKSDHLATFLTKKVRQLVDLDEVGTFGIDDSIFQLDDEVEEGVDGGRTNRSSEKERKFYFFSLQVQKSCIYAITKNLKLTK